MNPDRIPEMMKWRDLLRYEVRPKKFRMAWWFSERSGEGWKNQHIFNRPLYRKLLSDCTTAACAAGHAMALFGISDPDGLQHYLGLSDDEWYYIVDDVWPDDPEAAAERVDRVLRGVDLGDWKTRLIKGEGW